MDEPCPKAVLRDLDQTIQRYSITRAILKGNICACKACEEDWTESVENPIFEHCKTPGTVTIDFKDIVQCDHDPPYPDPPNGYNFTVPRMTSYTNADACCLWWAEEEYNGVVWRVQWIPRWQKGKSPPETLIHLRAPYEENGIGGLVYFSAPAVYGTKVEPCLPANGGWISNQCICGYTPDIHAGGGEARVRW